MATIIQCDGCDKQEKSGQAFNRFHKVKVLVVVSERDKEEKTPAFYDLCPGCLSHFEGKIDPKQWLRMAKEGDRG